MSTVTADFGMVGLADRPQAGFVHTDWLTLLGEKKTGGQK